MAKLPPGLTRILALLLCLLVVGIAYLAILLDVRLRFALLYSLAVVVGLGMLYTLAFLLARRLTVFVFCDRTGILAAVGPARLNAAVHSVLAFSIIVGWVSNRLWLPGRLHPVSLFADASVVVVALLLGFAIASPSVLKAVVTVLTAVVLTVVIVVVGGVRTGSRQTMRDAERLTGLAYVSFVPVESDHKETGVTYRDTSMAFNGLNLYCPGGTHKAQLLNMDGAVVHQWTADICGTDPWEHALLLEGGDLLVTTSISHWLVRLDWDSRVKWIDRRFHYHHDVDVAGNGDLYAIGRQAEVIWIRGLPVPIEHDYVVVMSEDREIRKTISFYDLLADRMPLARLIGETYTFLANPRGMSKFLRSPINIGGVQGEFFHINTLEIVRDDIDGVFKKGNLLFCSRSLNLIGVIDPVEEKLVWAWGDGVLDWPHHPTLLPSGNILVLDNGTHRGFSRVLEIDPQSGNIVWQYRAEPADQFFTAQRGSAQRLPNGNTLVTNGNSGQVFEVTPEGQIAWEFFSPLAEDGTTRSAIYRMIRYYDLERYPRLQNFLPAAAGRSR